MGNQIMLLQTTLTDIQTQSLQLLHCLSNSNIYKILHILLARMQSSTNRKSHSDNCLTAAVSAKY